MILTKECIGCSSVFQNHSCQTKGSQSWKNRKYCSRKCANNHLRPMTHIVLQCFYCKNNFRGYGSEKYCSRKCQYHQMSIDEKGSKNHQWKGDDVGYHGVHAWVKNTMGKACVCRFNPIHKTTRFNWANISGKYFRDTSDWISLCTSCHRLFDYFLQTIK